MGLSDALKNLTPALYRLRIFVFLLAAVVLAIVVYYFLYVRSQTGYFNDRNFRKLSLISSQIGSKISTAGSVLEKTSERFIRPPDEEEVYRFKATPTPKQENIAELQEVFKRLKDDSPQIIPFNIEVEKWTANAAPGTVTLTAVQYQGDSSWLYFDYVAHGAEPGTVIRVQAKTELGSLIQPFLTARIGPNPDQFQNILIAEADSARVILQHDTTQIRLASLDKLSAASPGKKIDLKEIAQTSNTVDIALAGANYRLFTHPLKLSLPTTSATGSNATWIVTGLVKSDYFDSAAWSISVPYTILVSCGFLVAVLVFSWPFLKLVLAGPKDRFRTLDVYLLVFATLIVLAVLTAFGLHVFVYWTVEAQLDDQVQRLARDLKRNVESELSQALDQLDKFGNNRKLLEALKRDEEQRKLAPSPKAGGLGRAGGIAQIDQNDDAYACPEEDRDIYDLDATNKSKILPCIMGSCDTVYPYFDTVSWINRDGMQRAKWSVRDYTTQYVGVSDRAYFQNIRKKHFYELGRHKFWLEPLVSRTTGRNQVEISQAVPDSDWTVAFDTRLLSLMDPVLPDAFGYVIIDNEGKVLFHSDEVHHLGENLFQECDDDNNLRSAVIGRSDKPPINVRYSGQDHRFFITTLDAFPDWSLVVFRNKEPLRSAFLELLTSLTFLFLLYTLVLMGAFTIFFIIYTRNNRKAWLWPEARKVELYVQLFYVMLVLSFVSLILTLFLHRSSVVWVSASLALFSGVVFFTTLRFGPWLPTRVKKPADPDESEPRLTLKRYDRLYALNLMLLVVLIAIVPMGAFFKYEYETQISLYIKHAQFSLAKALAQRDERIRSQYANVTPLGPLTCNANAPNHEPDILSKRLSQSWDVYDGFFYDTSHDNQAQTSNRPPSSDADLLTRLTFLLPVRSQSAVERRGLIDNTSVMGLGYWDSPSTERLVLNLNGSDGRTWPWRRLKTPVPILGISFLPGIALLVLFIPLFILLHFTVRKVFLLDIHKPLSHSLKKFLCDAIDRNVFVVVNAPFVKKMKTRASNLYLQKLSDFAASEDWNSRFDETQCGNGNVIALDQFEYERDNPQLNKRKLDLLEVLLQRNKTVVLFSTVDTSYYVFDNGEDPDDDEIAGRWGEVLISNFFTEYAEDTDDRYGDVKNESSFRQLVDALRPRVTEGLRPREAEKVNELIDTIYAECAPRVPLQELGLQILKRKDFVTLTKEDLLARIMNQAQPYYRHLWHCCSPGEKQTLCHLAQDRRLSHRDPDIEALLKRELIVRDEGLHLFNESFAKFVLAPEQLATVAADDQKAREESLWQILKVPILVTMITVAAFLFWTQQDIFSSSLAVVTGVTTLVTAVFKMMSMFHDPNVKSS